MQFLRLQYSIKAMINEIRNINLQLDINNVMFLMECDSKSEIYKEIFIECEKLRDRVMKIIEPIILFSYDKISDTISEYGYEKDSHAIFTIISIGDRISEMCTKAFKAGDYVAGMLLNCMADDLLFQLDNISKEYIVKQCISINRGIKKTLEAPNNISMEVQREILEKTEAEARGNIKINDSYMFTPIKTCSKIYLLDKERCEFNIDHNCSECKAIKCKLRKVTEYKVIVKGKKTTKSILVKDNETLLNALIREKLYIPSNCGGVGICGKCGVVFLEGYSEITQEDKKFFTKEELLYGKRLSCKAYIKSNCTILLDNIEEDFEIIAGDVEVKKSIYELDNNYNIIIDIGTTTIAIQEIESRSKNVMNTYTKINHQRCYGTDVINRINAANNGQANELRKIVIQDLKEEIDKIVGQRNNLPISIVISGNTSMVHFLLGYPCKTLGVYPFKAYSLSPEESIYKNVFGYSHRLNNIKIKFLPSISTFVGGDIVSGIIASRMDESSKINLFLDLGTNGELAIGNSKKILVTSTAAGPAFEGGNIKYGIGSVKGAISNIEIKDKKVISLKTIGDQEPIGICGTGVIEIVYELLKNKLIDTTGLLEEQYFEDGYPIVQNEKKIYFTAKDVREVQLAKSAIRAGIEILIKRLNINYEDIEHLYIAGGFGYKLNIKKAMAIGMFPKELDGKIKAIGNSSLEGAKIFATENIKDRIDNICKISEEISLGSDKEFNNLYIEHMYFNNVK